LPRLSANELSKVQEWMQDKSITRCPLCERTYPFGNITELGLAREVQEGIDEGHMPEKAGHVDLVVIPTFVATGAAGRNSSLPGPRQDARRTFSRIGGVFRALAWSANRQKAVRITCQNCGHIELFDARVIGVKGEAT
jgi:hypothetical protein